MCALQACNHITRLRTQSQSTQEKAKQITHEGGCSSADTAFFSRQRGLAEFFSRQTQSRTLAARLQRSEELRSLGRRLGQMQVGSHQTRRRSANLLQEWKL